MAYYYAANSNGKVMQARYAGICASCRSAVAAGETIRYNGQVHHLTAEHCIAAQAAAKKAAAVTETPKPTQPVADLTGIRNFIAAAKERGLKFPKLRVLDVDGRTELTLGLTSIGYNPGSVSVLRAGTYIGLIRPDGSAKGGITPALAAHLVKVAQEPAAAAKAYAVLMCRCSFCNLALTDAGSVEVGYGPVCAKHWGLPHAPKGTTAPQALTASERRAAEWAADSAADAARVDALSLAEVVGPDLAAEAASW